MSSSNLVLHPTPAALFMHMRLHNLHIVNHDMEHYCDSFTMMFKTFVNNPDVNIGYVRSCELAVVSPNIDPVLFKLMYGHLVTGVKANTLEEFLHIVENYRKR